MRLIVFSCTFSICICVNPPPKWQENSPKAKKQTKKWFHIEVLADANLTPILFPPSPNPAEPVLRVSSLMVALAEHFLKVSNMLFSQR